jgi:hypothetical protein
MSYKQALDAGLVNTTVIDTTTVNAETINGVIVNATQLNTSSIKADSPLGLVLNCPNGLQANIQGSTGSVGYALTVQSDGVYANWTAIPYPSLQVQSGFAVIIDPQTYTLTIPNSINSAQINICINTLVCASPSANTNNTVKYEIWLYNGTILQTRISALTMLNNLNGIANISFYIPSGTAYIIIAPQLDVTISSFQMYSDIINLG